MPHTLKRGSEVYFVPRCIFRRNKPTYVLRVCVNCLTVQDGSILPRGLHSGGYLGRSAYGHYWTSKTAYRAYCAKTYGWSALWDRFFDWVEA